VEVYLDDILMYKKNCVEHLQHIEQVLHTLQQHKLYGNLEKCSFGMGMVQYLYYNFYEHGMHVYLANIHAIHDWPAPNTLTKLQRFLGLSNFYCRFVSRFFHIPWALGQLTRGGAKKMVVWGL
jgi:hypothetical protein